MAATRQKNAVVKVSGHKKCYYYSFGHNADIFAHAVAARAPLFNPATSCPVEI
jgi:hypothetical protein